MRQLPPEAQGWTYCKKCDLAHKWFEDIIIATAAGNVEGLLLKNCKVKEAV